MNLETWLVTNKNEMVSWRRDLHKFPQVAWTEFYATGYIAQLLEKWGYNIKLGETIHGAAKRFKLPAAEIIEDEYQRALAAGIEERFIGPGRGGYTGLVAELTGAQPGPVVVFRFDIDGLTITESDSAEHLPVREGFGSLIPGYMHACGHDGHMAYGLLLAKWFAEHRNDITGTVRLIFQPGEEGGVGAGTMTSAGLVDDANFFFCGHIGIVPTVDDVIVVDPRGIMAVKRYEVRYTGRAAHAANNPHFGRNALLAACVATQNIYAISRHGNGSTQLNIGKLQAGSEWNVVAEQAYFTVEVRGATKEVCEYMAERALIVIKSAAVMYELECEIRPEAELVTSTNSPELVELAFGVAVETIGAEHAVRLATFEGSEDATYFMEQTKARGGQALFAVFATATSGGHHNKLFDFDERVLLTATEFFLRLYAKAIENWQK
ncbi:MAG: amidohydrolase [Bacillota bacterium]